jgi:hypothetical protein
MKTWNVCLLGVIAVMMTTACATTSATDPTADPAADQMIDTDQATYHVIAEDVPDSAAPSNPNSLQHPAADAEPKSLGALPKCHSIPEQPRGCTTRTFCNANGRINLSMSCASPEVCCDFDVN